MDNAFKMRRQYASIEAQIKSVSLLIEEIDQLSEEVATKILGEVEDLTLGEIESKYPDFSSLDEYKDLWLIGKKFGQGMSELRSALDYLVRFLAYANGNIPSEEPKFLVLDNKKRELPECYIQKKKQEFLGKECLKGLTCDQKLSIFSMQPAYTNMHWQAETLSAVHLHRNTYMHNAVPFVVPYLVPCPSSKDRRYRGDNGRICTKHDPNSKIKVVGFEVWVYKDLCRLERVMVRSRLYGEPAKLLGDHRKTIIGIMQQLTSTVDTDFEFEFPGAPYQSKP